MACPGRYGLRWAGESGLLSITLAPTSITNTIPSKKNTTNCKTKTSNNMKKVFLSLTLLIGILSAATAQNEKYVRAMQDKVVAIDTLRNAQSLLDLSAAFERIGDAEKAQWLPYYY